MADALAYLGIRYGSELAAGRTLDLVSLVQTAAYRASAALAAETEPYPLWDTERFLETETARQLDQQTLDFIANNGLRNSHLTSIAPTGTISLVAGNVSGGIEPVFAHSYTRRVLQPDNSHTEERVESASMALWRRLHGDEPPPDYFVDAGTISPEDHVRMQAAAQAHIDSAVSKTVNVPKDISFEAFKDIYLLAWESGCKGCTTYRPNDITGAILVADGDNPGEPAPTVMDRPSVLHGQTRKVPWPGSEHAFYLTLNHTVDRNGNNRPFEIFIATKDARHHAWVTAVTRMISAVWRRQGDVGFVAEELMAIADPNDGQWVKGRGWVASLIALIGMEIRTGWSSSAHRARRTPPRSSPGPEAGDLPDRCRSAASLGWSTRKVATTARPAAIPGAADRTIPRDFPHRQGEAPEMRKLPNASLVRLAEIREGKPASSPVGLASVIQAGLAHAQPTPAGLFASRTGFALPPRIGAAPALERGVSADQRLGTDRSDTPDAPAPSSPFRAPALAPYPPTDDTVLPRH